LSQETLNTLAHKYICQVINATERLFAHTTSLQIGLDATTEVLSAWKKRSTSKLGIIKDQAVLTIGEIYANVLKLKKNTK